MAQAADLLATPPEIQKIEVLSLKNQQAGGRKNEARWQFGSG
jgi:hypothetical protein